jgi:hypothetical protein
VYAVYIRERGAGGRGGSGLRRDLFCHTYLNASWKLLFIIRGKTRGKENTRRWVSV